MLKNTYYIILFLSVLAALVLGLNIGKGIQQKTMAGPTLTPAPVLFENIQQLTSPSGIIKDSTDSASNIGSTSSGAQIKGKTYTNTACGISLTYPDTVTLEESSTETLGTLFTNKTNPKDIVVLTCQKEIPTPPLSQESIENFAIGNVTGKLYHDTSAKDGTKTDALLFTHPITKLDVFIGGYGTVFDTIIQSLKIL